MTDLHFIALDGGGTGCRAVICGPDGVELARVSGGGANLTSDFDSACRNITDTLTAAYHAAGMDAAAMDADIAILGVAGAEVGDAAARLAARLGFAASRVLSDQDITIAGVLGEDDGTVAQIGTGSFFATRQAGTVRRAGGRGLVLGDECSGAWLGRDLLRAAIRACDGLGDSSPLTDSVLAEFDDDPHRIVLFARDASAAAFAGYAPRLFAAANAGDAIAGGIITDAANELERIVARIEDGATPPLYLCGGVGEQLTPFVSTALRDRIAVPDGDGLSGALRMARALHDAGQGQRSPAPWIRS